MANPGAHRRPAWRLAGLGLLLLLGGCASVFRLDPPPAADATRIPVLGVANARFWPDGPPEPIAEELARMVAREQAAMPAPPAAPPPRPGRRAAARPAPLPPANLLALSGGADDGAFGAGLLVGWTAAGGRPAFNIVTGISAGALIAPFAFLGPDYDPPLRAVFTEVRPADLVRVGNLVTTAFSALFGEAIADTSPLYALIQQKADQRMLEAIAAEYRRGRLLLIGTTNLDLQRPVIWNIGAIAASGHPQALALFQRILLASASVPGAFPPVLVDIEHQGRRFQEMHVDGGAATQVFLYPATFEPRMALPVPPRPGRTVWVVRNGRMEMEAASTTRGLFSIARRSISTLLHFSAIGDIGRIWLAAKRDGLDFRLAHIGPGFRTERREAFDPDYMRALFDYGFDKARRGDAWVDAPPVVTTLDPLAP